MDAIWFYVQVWGTIAGYWCDNAGTIFEAYCDMDADGGGVSVCSAFVFVFLCIYVYAL